MQAREIPHIRPSRSAPNDASNHSNADAVVDVGRSCCYLRNLRVADFPPAICVASPSASAHTASPIRHQIRSHTHRRNYARRIHNARLTFYVLGCRIQLCEAYSLLLPTFFPSLPFRRLCFVCEWNNGRGSNAVEHGFGCLRTIGRKRERENEHTSVRTISFQLKR